MAHLILIILVKTRLLIGMATAIQDKHTGGPRYMRKIGTAKIGLHIRNSHIKRPTITAKIEDRFLKKAIFQSHIREIADKKTAYNEGRLYCLKSEMYDKRRSF